MYTLEDVYKTFPSGCTEDYKILRAFEMGKQASEKRIEELEHQLTHRNCIDCSNHSSKLRMRTLELEKENAELKAENTELKSGCGMCYRKDKENLTKAKEIIREFVEWATWQGSNCPNFKSIQDKAEQFIKDSEVEK